MSQRRGHLYDLGFVKCHICPCNKETNRMITFYGILNIVSFSKTCENGKWFLPHAPILSKIIGEESKLHPVYSRNTFNRFHLSLILGLFSAGPAETVKPRTRDVNEWQRR